MRPTEVRLFPIAVRFSMLIMSNISMSHCLLLSQTCFGTALNLLHFNFQTLFVNTFLK